MSPDQLEARRAGYGLGRAGQPRPPSMSAAWRRGWHDGRRLYLAAGRRPSSFVPLPPDEEYRALLREHGTYLAVARALGRSEAGVRERCIKLGLRSPNRRGGPRACDVCHVTTEDAVVLPFMLMRRRGAQGSLSCGSINLCESCWRPIWARRRRAA